MQDNIMHPRQKLNKYRDLVLCVNSSSFIFGGIDECTQIAEIKKANTYQTLVDVLIKFSHSIMSLSVQ